jgi:hypothetical protein
MTTNISSIQSGIVFLMAEWSGQAKWACGQLKSFLAPHQAALANLVCIDVGRDPGIYDLPELSGKIHGYGEAAVIKNGKVVFVTVLGKDKIQTQNRCEELLKVYKA